MSAHHEGDLDSRYGEKSGDKHVSDPGFHPARITEGQYFKATQQPTSRGRMGWSDQCVLLRKLA